MPEADRSCNNGGRARILISVVSRHCQTGFSPRALLALSITLALLGGLHASVGPSPQRPAEHVLANRAPITAAVTFDGPEFALVVFSRALSAPTLSHSPILYPTPVLEMYLAHFAHYIRPPPAA